MNIYVALNDQPAPGGKSSVVGAFSTEDGARAACTESAGRSLAWKDAEADGGDRSSYAVVLVDLDVPV
jgi:hypothetical protein